MRKKAQRLVRCALFAAMLCICSVMSVPTAVVPFSLGLLGVLLLSLCLTPAEAVTSVAVYLALGFCGVPLFAGGIGGVGVLLSPTGGFLVGYLLTSVTVSFLTGFLQKDGSIGFFHAFCVCLLGVLLCHAVGIAWWMAIGKVSLDSAFVSLSLPFLLVDALKALLAAMLAKRLRSALK